jgi:cation:H+ antiporter
MDQLSIILFIAGFVLLTLGADLLVRSASRLAVMIGISPLVIGLTIVAYGTSAPELAVSIQSAYAGSDDLALGNVVGSNIFNILVIVGLSAMITPMIVSQQLVRLDIPLMIGVSVLMTVMGLDGTIGRFDGIILVMLLIGYTVWTIRQSRKEQKEIAEQYEREFGIKKEATTTRAPLQIVMLIGGVLLLALGSQWLVDGAVAIALALEISELIIGLTIVAVGTSLPEVATSVVASIRGERDIAVGNIIGSNIFNILSVLGISSVVSPAGINVPAAAMSFDIPVMLAVSFACLPIFFHESRINRWEGALFVGYYLAYATYIVMDATGHEYLPHFSVIMMEFVLPLTLVTLGIIMFRYIRAGRHKWRE